MKKFLLIFFFTLLFSVVYAGAEPKLEQIPSSIYTGEISRNETITLSFKLNNTGNVTLTNIVPNSDFGAKFNATGFSLGVNGSKVIKMNFTIAPDSPTGNVTVGNTFFESDQYDSPHYPVTAIIKGGLEITDLDVTLIRMDTSTDVDSDVQNGDKLDFGDDGIGPGSSLQFDFRIENLFSDKEDIEVRDVSALVTIKEIDDEEDIEEESEDIDIDPGEREDLSVTLDIPLKVEAREYDIEILIRGEDEEGVSHTIEWELEMEVKKERHDVYIDYAYLTEEKILCSGTTYLKTNIINLGNREEDDVMIEAENSDLDLDFTEDDIFLTDDPYDDDNEYGKLIPIVVKNDVGAGTYPIDFKVYIEGVILFTTKRVNLVVEACETEEEQEEEVVEEEKNETVVTEEPEEEETGEEITIPILTEEKTVTEEKGFSTSTLIYGSVIVTLIIIFMIIILVLVLAPKKK